MNFCVDAVYRDKELRLPEGLLRKQAAAILFDARAMADKILQEAHEEAQRLSATTQEQVNAAVLQAESDAMQRIGLALRAMERQQAAFLERSQDMVVTLAVALFERLAAQLSDRERIECLARRLLLEAPSRLKQPLLRAHPDDIPHLPTVEWEIKEDASMAIGSLCLEAAGGEWRVDFQSAVSELKAALLRLEDGATPAIFPAESRRQ